MKNNRVLKIIISQIWLTALCLAIIAPFWNSWYFIYSFTMMLIISKYGAKIEKYLS
jgi:hypothetical protein